MLDEYLIFITYRPALVGKDGWPLSWQHYKYGLRSIAREQLRMQMWLAQGVRMANTMPEEYAAWQKDITMVTEVPRHNG